LDNLSKLFGKFESKWGFGFILVIALMVAAEVVLYNLAMVNEAIWLGISFTWFFVIIGMYKLFGKWGLFTAFIINSCMLNLQVLQITDVWGFTTGAGGDCFNFLITDILVEKYGRREGMKCVGLGIVTMVVFVGMMWLTTLLQAGEYAFIHDEYNAVFGVVPRIAGASLLAFVVAQTNDVILFSKIRAKTKGRFLWLRNNVSTLASQAIDLTIFNLVAFWGLISLSGIIEMAQVGYGQELVFALTDTFFIYLAVAIKPMTFMGKDEGIPAGIPEDVEA